MLLDAVISFPTLIALHLHIWDKRFLTSRFWRAYAFIFAIWDLLFNLVLQPMHSGKRFDPWDLTVFVVLVPLYVSVFRYGFRSWGENALPNPALQADSRRPAALKE